MNRLMAVMLLVLIPLPSHSKELKQYLFSGKPETLVEFGEDKLIVTKNCQNGADYCQALRAIVNASTEGTSEPGGANPGAVICAKIGGVVIIAKDASGNEQSFCRFADRSMISTGSVYKKAVDNDLREKAE